MAAIQQMLLGKSASGGSFTYATWNPADKHSTVTLSGSDLIATSTGGSVRSTIGKSSGKWYWEVTMSTVAMPGIANSSASLSSYFGSGGTDSYGWYSGDGNLYFNSAPYIFITTFTTGQVLGFALDMDAGTLAFYKANTLYYTLTGLTGTQYAGTGYSGATTANFGASALTYTPPTGFASGLYT